MAGDVTRETSSVKRVSDPDPSEEETSTTTFRTGDVDQENNRRWKAVHDCLSDALDILDQIEIYNDSDRRTKEKIQFNFGDALDALYEKAPFLA